MAARPVVRLRAEVLALAEQLWCFDCHIPAGVRLWVAVVVAGRHEVHVLAKCRDCGGRRIEPGLGSLGAP